MGKPNCKIKFERHTLNVLFGKKKIVDKLADNGDDRWAYNW